MTREELINAIEILLSEHTVEELREVLTQVAGGTPDVPLDSPILDPYREMLESEAAVIQQLRGLIGNKEPTKSQKLMLEAYDAIVGYFNRLVEVGGDVSKAGEIPRVQWTPGTGSLRWLGQDVRARIEVYVDGKPFSAAPISRFISDPRAILAGCTDPTGGYWQKYNIVNGKAYPCWNRSEMAVKGEDLNRIRNFDLSKGSLRSDPMTWPDTFKAAWFEGHPLYQFLGHATERQPWVVD